VLPLEVGTIGPISSVDEYNLLQQMPEA